VLSCRYPSISVCSSDFADARLATTKVAIRLTAAGQVSTPKVSGSRKLTLMFSEGERQLRPGTCRSILPGADDHQ